MKILVIGSDKIYAIENFYVRYLRSAGNEVIHFPAQRLFLDEYNSSFYKKFKFRLHNNSLYSKINADLIKQLQEQSSLPAVAFVFKGMEIFPATLSEMKKMGITLVNYNPDNPFLFSGRGSGNQNVTDSIALYDFHFTYNLQIKKQIEEQFHLKTAWLPFGFDIDDSLYKECEEQEEIMEVCFLGNPDKERVGFILELLKKNISVTIYGHDWNKFLTHPRVKIKEAVYGPEFWKTLRRYRVQINLMRQHNLDSHNMRTFEVPGVGGLMVAPDTLEHRMFFDDHKEILLFKDVDSCAAKINWLLQLSGSEASVMRQSARDKSVSSGYTYRDRARQVSTILQDL